VIDRKSSFAIISTELTFRPYSYRPNERGGGNTGVAFGPHGLDECIGLGEASGPSEYISWYEAGRQEIS